MKTESLIKLVWRQPKIIFRAARRQNVARRNLIFASIHTAPLRMCEHNPRILT